MKGAWLTGVSGVLTLAIAVVLMAVSAPPGRAAQHGGNTSAASQAGPAAVSYMQAGPPQARP